jgi:hypothetical protein
MELSIASAYKVHINPLPDKKSVRSIRLDFFCAIQCEPIQVELPARLAKGVADAILEVLNAGKNPPRPSRARAVGKPKLRIVK